MNRRWGSYSLRVLLIAAFVSAIGSAWMATRLRKMQTERRIAAMCVQFGATITRSEEDRGWITGLHFSTPTDLQDEHMRELAKLQHLRVLYLNQTEVTGEGLGVLTEFPALRELHVNEAQLTAEGIKHLKKLNQLERIQFWGLSSDDPRARSVRRSLPNIGQE